MQNYQEDFWNKLFRNKSEYPPSQFGEGFFYMDLDSNIYVYLEGKWQKTEAVQFDQKKNDNDWINEILDNLGILP